MEHLKILDSSGRTLAERALEPSEKGPILVVADGAGVRLVPAVAAGERLVAALVRDVDGWTLAAADAATPVVCGAKRAGSFALVAGSACSVADYVFRLESDVALSGNVLLWRVGKSAVAAENVASGRNLVAADALRGGSLTVNPAVPGVVRFEFYPTVDGLDIVLPSGGRTRIAARLVFAVGDFTGLLLPAADAAAALRSGNPFSYPSRGVRVRLMAALLGVGLVVLLGAYLSREAARVERLADAPRGVRAVVGTPVTAAVDDDDAYIYMLAFYRDLPLVLGARRSPVADDFIARAAGLGESAEVARAARFLKDVTAIQDLVAARRWDELAARLKGIDREMFTIANATRFLEDVQEVLTCASKLIPEAARTVCRASAAEREAINAKVARTFADMSDNLFVQSDSLKGWFQGVREKRTALFDYLAVRDRVCASDGARAAADVEALRASFATLVQVFGDDLAAVSEDLRRELEGFVTATLQRLTMRFRTATDFAPEMSAIVPLCELAADVGIAADRVRAWRQDAQRIDRLVDTRFRACYQEYRLTAADNPARARQLIDEMLAISQTSNKFYAWARRERARLDAADAEGKEESK